ncbi:MAG: lipoyl(octanoyl) transferase LipB [Rickettsiella sp.]|nr:lipoyl(octanoyl) transferase LipB [Rickettsiella sp.]
METSQIIIRPLRRSAEYYSVCQAMSSFTNTRSSETPDEIWLIEHDPVYTLGQAAKLEHILNPGDIPIIKTDRGGQITYHGPGQLVVYPLLNLRRLNLNVRALITLLEDAIIGFLATYGIQAQARKEAPGVYVNNAKIASIGLRIRRGFCYHGIAFNVAMDLKPFSGINPCGFSQLAITQLSDLGGPKDLEMVANTFSEQLKKNIVAKK